ncbi:MAG TPA: bifunctional isocitrate dehydrogenase kinase/phosphatase [Gemmatimonadales bacterium]|nr:bifunctional isocitrate dehydrogenase kinase/phosphatase [Gemmatimonadales bacterium]
MNGNVRPEPAAAGIFGEYQLWYTEFAEVTRRARQRFQSRDWHGTQADAAERLALYRLHVETATAYLHQVLDGDIQDRKTWTRLRSLYAGLTEGRDDAELAETFFNSVSRRVLGTIGATSDAEFIEFPASGPLARTGPMLFDTYRGEGTSRDLVSRLLAACGWDVPYANASHDVELVASVIDNRLCELRWERGPLAIDVLRSPFYRNKGAYLIGRVHGANELLPLVVALVHGKEGILVDAVLLTQDEASVVFGFSWSYFFVEAPHPRGLITFLQSIMPHKRIDELYTSIGYSKHGKTELYRSLMRHMERPEARFALAEGDEGMVMCVFALPSFNLVFKIIRDRFGAPKNTTRRAVMDRYHFVFQRDRVGRLADAQEFENLELRRRCFPEDLLAYLKSHAGRSVEVKDESVLLRHVYTERRVTPLNLFLLQADAGTARETILDYGNAIKDLAGANIFTGDMLLKNFGVTRNGRVICYDYDELCLLTDCTIRRLPPARTPEDEMAAEPWFHVGEHDVFPEEFAAFLIPGDRLRGTFLGAHSDLLTPDFWTGVQRRLEAGEIFDFFPYKQARRLHRDGAG